MHSLKLGQRVKAFNGTLQGKITKLIQGKGTTARPDVPAEWYEVNFGPDDQIDGDWIMDVLVKYLQPDPTDPITITSIQERKTLGRLMRKEINAEREYLDELVHCIIHLQRTARSGDPQLIMDAAEHFKTQMETYEPSKIIRIDLHL